MIQTAGSAIAPFNVGVSLSNGSADIAKYNVFVIILQDTAVSNTRIACTYSRHSSATTQNYSLYTYNSSYEYWNWFSITLSGNTFSFDGAYGSPRTSSYTGTRYLWHSIKEK